MGSRSFSIIDRAIGEIHSAINTLAASPAARRPLPAPAEAAAALPLEQRQLSARLMRVNHAGEVAAQALYQGQALTSKDPEVARALRAAALEESDHLAWCDERLRELGARGSALNPVWYAGSFLIGALAGAVGRGTGLGFVAETERQEEAHLRGHTSQLAGDARSLAIIDQMTHDEIEHGAKAASLGAERLPVPVTAAMRLTARVMTQVSYWL